MDWRIYDREYLLRGLRNSAPHQKLDPPSFGETLLLGFFDLMMICLVAVFWLISKIPILDSLLETSVRTFSRGGLGFFLRGAYYKNKLKRMGKNVLIDLGAVFWFPENVEIDDYAHIDMNTIISGGGKGYGYVRIGKYVHVSHGCYVAGRGGVEIQDYAGIAGGSSIYSASNYYKDPTRPGAWITTSSAAPAHEQYVVEKPVVIERNAFIGLQCVILPGVRIGHDSVIGANSLVVKDVPPLSIAVGSPVRVVSKREFSQPQEL